MTVQNVASAVAIGTVVGVIRLANATRADYRSLERHHYRCTSPATFCRIRGAWHEPAGGERRLVGVAVLSWPVPMLWARRRHFRLEPGYGVALRFANQNVRTISRVIVHPQFRAVGIARRLVLDLIGQCPTRYVETSALMGDVVGCFEAGGMTRVPTPAGEPAYFLFDKETHS